MLSCFDLVGIETDSSSICYKSIESELIEIDSGCVGGIEGLKNFEIVYVQIIGNHLPDSSSSGFQSNSTMLFLLLDQVT